MEQHLHPITAEQALRFEQELLPHADSLFNFAMHLTGYKEEDSNDLVQDAYFKALRFMDKYETGTNPKAWLFTILKNAFINEYRKKVKQPTKVDYEEIAHYHHDEEHGSGFMDLREEVFANLLGDEVSKAIGDLPQEFRTVIILCDIEGFSYEEIAGIVDIPIGTVRSRLHRARNLLKEKLKIYAEDLGYKDKRS
ncbi:MAG: sigma-70 family RNA polymerase sigma factor [Saprospiraceae bacterium]